ncbi:MPE1 [Colletotrichum lupini]|uniref:MPE1 n=2 Tax=Colletotrichum acutatum species complex TaxID=2707335 RepID=A0A9Q8WJC8_9PEZI|nr:MPE1 [Colletotrichum lupini]KAK1469167.1 MPE1 [Colletotrichum melonis]KAK1716910.1 DWNN domain-containing protein [Colletotrichum lupini]UQC84937.1 MPE1 [Colletotrichum lupini]
MASSVFFKFKSQKEPTRVEFDGTGISVFELKRDIILKSGLGDGTDFDLAIYSEDGSEEYDDDTTIIPRSTTVVARRLPAAKPGAGRGARYVSGKMPVAAKNSSRKEQTTKSATAKAASNAISQMNNAMTEEEKMAAMFQAQTESWSAQQEEMSNQTPVFKPGSKKPANVPDHDPPNGYICYRCGEKGHWIQLCPTNDDPEFDNRPRVKRTTGIPRSFLRTVDKSVALAQSGDDETKRPSGIMVNAEGEFVIAEPDKASWEQFQAKAKSSASAAKAIAMGDKELQDQGLECPIDKKMFIDPMKTPCCQKTYCNDCITNALIESDFVCPNCSTEGVLIDDLKADEEAAEKMKEFLKEKNDAKSPTAASPPPASSPKENGETKTESANGIAKSPTSQKSPAATAAAPASVPTGPKADGTPKSTSATPATAPSGPTAERASSVESNSKKRPADELMENPKIPKAPKAMQKQQEQQQAMMNGMNGMGNMPMDPMMGFGGMNMMNGFMGMPNMPNMPNMGNMGNMGNMNMGMPMMGMMNPMMGMPGFNPMNGGGFPGMGGNNNMYGNNFGGNMNGMNHMNGMNGGMNGGGMNGGGMNGGGMGGYNQQQRHNFTQPSNDEDAYFRRPVNPHRHQNRQKRVRPSDYREL